MKAILVREFGGPEVMKLEEIPGLQPGPGQVLVSLKAAGVNPVDAYIRSGTYARKPALPYTPGMDGAGVVEQVGSGNVPFKAGDRVYVEYPLTGTYAESCLAETGSVHPLPSNISFAQGAALGVPYATAHRSLFGRAQAVAGETLLVHGATGGVGIAAVQIGKAAGLTVIGTGGTEEGRKLVMEQGADHVLDHRAPDYLEQVMALTGDKGVDVILEMAAHLNLGKDLTVLAKRGRVVVIGSRGTVEINPRDTMSRDAAILGMTLFNATPQERAQIHQDLVKGMEKGLLKPIVGREIPLAQAPQAQELVLQMGAYGKIVLIP
ncbi:MAG TPA: NADPH:quinone reductase [bacterium]|nr:NADPH:quinone reductase [bacterium]